MISLDILDLVLASVLVVALAIVSIIQNLGIAKSLIIAASRTAIQLSLLGLILKFVFDNAHIIWVALIALVMTLVASREVTARQRYRFQGKRAYFIGISSMLVSSLFLTMLTLLLIIQNDPWYAPQYAIPLLGMLLGNTMTSIALSLDHLTQNAYQQKDIIEAKLLMGFTAKEAIHDIKRESIRVGLIPMINAMVAAGIISLPGMMTGQILAGAPPMEAVKYQILIMFLISGGAGFGSIIAVNLGAMRLFDQRERLRLDSLNPL